MGSLTQPPAMAPQRDMAHGHRRPQSAPAVTFHGDRDSASSGILPDSAHTSPVRSQRSSSQLHLQAQRDATAAANRSASQLRRVAMRLAARLAVKDSRESAQAKSLQRVRMSQYTAERTSAAQIARLCSTLDEKEQKGRDLVAILAPIAPIEATNPLSKLPKNYSDIIVWRSVPISDHF
jgi:hypothetical protein